MKYQEIYKGPNEIYSCSSIVESKGFTLLMRLCYNKTKKISIEEIKKYLEKHLEEINKQNFLGWTALMLSARNSNTDSSTEIVKLLLEKRADPNLRDHKGWSALMLSARYSNTESNIETVKLLLKYGADVNLYSIDGWTSLMLSVHCSNTESNIKTVKLLLKKGTIIDHQNKGSKNALQLAIKNIENGKSNIETVILLSNWKLLCENKKLKKELNIYQNNSTPHSEAPYIPN